MIRPGRQTRKLEFQRRALDGNNERLGAWTAVDDGAGGALQRTAEVVCLKGGEAVQAQRLAGSEPALVLVRRDSILKAIDNSWRCVDVRDPGVVFDITATSYNERKRQMELLVTQSKAGDNG